jgi:hypothetical protein
MAVIPGAETLEREPSSRTLAVPSQFRDSIGSSIEQAGRGLQRIAGQISNERDKEDEFYTKARLAEFIGNQQEKINQFKMEANERPVDFAQNTYATQTADFTEFFKTVPDSQKPWVDTYLVKAREQFKMEAFKFEKTQIRAYDENIINDTVSKSEINVYQNPDEYESQLHIARGLIQSAPEFTESERKQKLEAVEKKLEIARTQSLIERYPEKVDSILGLRSNNIVNPMSTENNSDDSNKQQDINNQNNNQNNPVKLGNITNNPQYKDAESINFGHDGNKAHPLLEEDDDDDLDGEVTKPVSVVRDRSADPTKSGLVVAGNALNGKSSPFIKVDSNVRNTVSKVADQFFRDTGKKVVVFSGHRSLNHPMEARKGKNALHRHTSGKAVDIDITNLNAREKELLVASLVGAGATSIGSYPSGTSIHVDWVPIKNERNPGNLSLWYGKNNWKQGESWYQAGIMKGLEYRKNGILPTPDSDVGNHTYTVADAEGATTQSFPSINKLSLDEMLKLKKVADSARKDKLDNFFIEIMDDQVSMDQITAAKEAGLIRTASEYSTAQRLFEDVNSERIARQQAQARLENPNEIWDPRDAQDRKLLNSFIKPMEEGIQNNDTSVADQLLSLVNQTQAIPPRAARLIERKALSENPADTLYAYSTLSRIRQVNPNLITTDIPERVRVNLDTFERYAEYLTPEELGKKLSASREQIPIEIMKSRKEEARTKISKLSDEQLRSKFDGGLFDISTDLPSDSMVKDTLKVEYKDLFVERYAETGDEELAHSQALTLIKSKWGVSTLNNNEIMPYPPEKYYRPVDTGDGPSYDWMDSQLKSEIEKHWYGRYPGAKPGPGYSMAEKTINRIVLIPDQKTKEAASSNLPTPYKVAVITLTGAIEPVTNDRNQPIHFIFDQKKANDAARIKLSKRRESLFRQMTDEAKTKAAESDYNQFAPGGTLSNFDPKTGKFIGTKPKLGVKEGTAVFDKDTGLGVNESYIEVQRTTRPDMVNAMPDTRIVKGVKPQPRQQPQVDKQTMTVVPGKDVEYSVFNPGGPLSNFDPETGRFRGKK